MSKRRAEEPNYENWAPKRSYPQEICKLVKLNLDNPVKSRFGYIRRDSDLDGSDPPQEPSTSSQDLITDPEFYKALQELEDEQREQEEEEQEVEEFEEYLEEIVDVKPIVSNNDNVNTAQHLNYRAFEQAFHDEIDRQVQEASESPDQVPENEISSFYDHELSLERMLAPKREDEEDVLSFDPEPSTSTFVPVIEVVSPLIPDPTISNRSSTKTNSSLVITKPTSPPKSTCTCSCKTTKTRSISCQTDVSFSINSVPLRTDFIPRRSSARILSKRSTRSKAKRDDYNYDSDSDSDYQLEEEYQVEFNNDDFQESEKGESDKDNDDEEESEVVEEVEERDRGEQQGRDHDVYFCKK